MRTLFAMIGVQEKGRYLKKSKTIAAAMMKIIYHTYFIITYYVASAMMSHDIVKKKHERKNRINPEPRLNTQDPIQ